MDKFCQRRPGRGPNRSGRTVDADQSGERRFKCSIFAHERIIVYVGNLGRVTIVIQFVVPRDLFGETHQAVGGFGFGHATLVRQERGGGNAIVYIRPLIFHRYPQIIPPFGLAIRIVMARNSSARTGLEKRTAARPQQRSGGGGVHPALDTVVRVPLLREPVPHEAR